MRVCWLSLGVLCLGCEQPRWPEQLQKMLPRMGRRAISAETSLGPTRALTIVWKEPLTEGKRPYMFAIEDDDVYYCYINIYIYIYCYIVIS